MRGFNNVYESIYKDCQEELEKLRIKRNNRKIVNLLKAMIVSIVVFGITKAIIRIKMPLGINIAIFAIVSISIIIYYYRKETSEEFVYNTVYKGMVIGSIVKGYSEKLNYNPNKKFYLSKIFRIFFDKNNDSILRAFLASEFEKDFDHFYYEDTIYGQLKEKHEFTMTEVKTEKEYRDNDGTVIYTKKTFHGIFAINKFDYIVNTTIKIRDNAKILLNSDNSKLEMDSGEFEKNFNVYAQDKIIAMQLLTADVMQMLIDFKNENNIIPEITIKNSNLYIRLKTGDMFEDNIFKDSLDYSTLKKYYDIIKFTVELSEKLVDNIVQTEI